MRADRPSVVITGLGAVTPLGVGVPAFARALRAGRSGVSLLSFQDSRLKSSVAARCTDFDSRSVMSAADITRVPALIPMAVAAAREAMTQAGLQFPNAAHAHAALYAADHLSESAADTSHDLEPTRQIGLILGTGGGGIDFTLTQAAAFHAGERTSLWTITNATHGNLAGELSITLGLRGPSLCVSTGCASSSDAVGIAMDQLRSDRPGAPRAVVVIGADAHVRVETIMGMELLRVISTRDFRQNPSQAGTASRPFDQSRDGFVLGEGAWAVVLERADHATQRGARPIARALGYGATCDAYHRVRPAPDLHESARAIELALADATLETTDIEFVHYHGTGTPLNDATETAVIKKVFREHAPKLRGHSVKSSIGHPQGAGGLAALVSTLAGLTNADAEAGEGEGVGAGAFLLPTINLNTPDAQCDLNYTPNHATLIDPETGHNILINCLAFGAKNSALIVRSLPPR